MKLRAPAAARNLEPIRDALVPLLATRRGDVLEIGSGTGEHAVGLASTLPQLTWWPSDPDPRHRASIDAHAADRGLSNLRPALGFDAAADWPLGGPDEPPVVLTAIFSANVIHISPWAVTRGIIRGAGRYLAGDGLLVLYGPFGRDGGFDAPSNAAFDADLRARNPQWGVRDLTEIEALADRADLVRTRTIAMPANNQINVFARRDAAEPRV